MKRRPRNERGATAILVALLAVVLFGAAALGVDYSSLVMERQKLHDHIDSAAHSGAFELPSNGLQAKSAARSIALEQDSAINPAVNLFCVVASTGSSPYLPSTAQIPSTCYPGPSPYNYVKYPAMRCNAAICAIPCPDTGVGITCNTVQVSDNKTVDFKFAPVMGIDSGRTGSVASAACKGSCGAESPNPMDIVVLADRTLSMSESNRRAMVTGIEDALKTMNPQMHYVALGALHKSVGTDNNCLTQPWPAPRAKKSSETNSQYQAFVQGEIVKGKWVATPFSNNYLTASATPTLNTASPLVKAVKCISNTSSPVEYRTHLASALKGAARYLLGKDPNNLGSLPSTREGTVKKVILFETDGKPQEVLNAHSGGLSLNTAGDMGVGGESASQLRQACKNATDVATQAKAEKALIITVGFGEANTASCGSSTVTPYVRDALAAAASPHPATGLPSQANSDCSTPAERTTENSDGDFYYCAVSGSELGPIFSTAISSLANGIKLIRMP